MTKTVIHPTAIIEEGAIIGEGVEIGPFCHISGKAVIGDNCRLMTGVVVIGATTLGENATVFPHAVLGADPQNNKHKGGETTLVIGKNCVIREGVTMHRGSDSSIGKTVVGDNCMFLAYAHVAHDCYVGHHVTFSNNVTIGGHVVVGDYVIIGGGAAVHQFVRVGERAFIGGLAAVVGDVIPFGIAIGVQAHLGGINIIGMKRAGFERSEIHAMRHAYSMLFDKTGVFRERARDVSLAYPHSKTVAQVVAFIDEDSKRSYCTPEK